MPFQIPKGEYPLNQKICMYGYNAKRVVMITDDQLILLAYKLIKARTTLKSMGLWIFLVDTNTMELIT